MHEVPARARALAERIDHAVERQPLRLREGHGLGNGLDDSRAHDLVGGFGRLAAAGVAEVGDGLAERRKYRTRTLERFCAAADHDGERGVAGSFGAATHGAVEKRSLSSVQQLCGPARGFGADGRAIDDERAGGKAGRKCRDDVEHVLIR